MIWQKLKGKPLWSNLKGNQDFLIITVVLLIKILLFSIEAGLSSDPTKMILSSAAVLLTLSCWFLLLPYFARTSLLLVFDFVVSFGLLADSVFYRFFHSVISIPVLFEAGQVKGVSSSVMQLFSRWDVLLFIDFLVLIPYFIRLNKTNPGLKFRFRKKLGQFAVLLIVCILTLGFTTKGVAANFSKNAYVGLNLDETVLRNMGVVNYHLFDLYSYIKENRSKEFLASDAEQIKAWMEQHRQQGGTNLAGVAKGKNLIIVQLEAMQNFVVNRSINGQEVTPNLNRLISSSMYFDNYFTQIAQGNTSDAEFIDLNSLYPSASGSNYILKSKNTYQSLPTILAGAGYQGSYAFHANTPQFWNRANMYRAEGFSKFYNNSNFFNQDETVGMGLSDESMYRQVAAQLQKLKQPYFSFIISLSAHYPYDIPAGKKSLNIPKGQYSDMFTNYLQSQNYADQALGKFIDQLQQQGVLDNSVLVVYGDHYGTGWTNQDLEKFLGKNTALSDYETKELNKVPLLIHLPGGHYTGVKHISGGQMDLMPTLLNLLGISDDKAFYFGQDLLNAKDGFSVFRSWAPEGSFATNEVFYIASPDGKFSDGSAYDRNTGQKIGLQGLENSYALARWHLQTSDLILQTNGLARVLNP